MRTSRNVVHGLSLCKHSFHRRTHKFIFSISHRHQSTDTEPEKANIMESDDSILQELGTFDLSEVELMKISDNNGQVIIDGIEYLQSSDIFYAKFFPVKTTQFLLDWSHDFMPYWLVILTVPWIIKAFVIMPSIIYTGRKYESIAHLMPKALEDFAYLHNRKKESTKLENAKYYGEISQDYNERNKALKAKYGFNPYLQQFKQLLPMMLQLPVHMSLFVATRTMYPSYPDWKEGGVAWFSDLSLGDPYYVWPSIAASTMIFSAWQMKQNSELQQKFQNVPINLIFYATTAMSLVFIPMMGQFPVGLNIYVASNIISYGAQNALMESTKFRNSVGLRPKSYLTNINAEISKKNAELKHIVNSGAVKKFDGEIKGKRKAKGKEGRKMAVKVK